MPELVSDLLDQHESFSSKTDLSRVVKTPLNARGHGCRNVRIFTDNEGVGSAQLHHRLLDDFARLGRNSRPGPHAPRHGRALYARVINDTHDVVSLQNQVLKDAFRITSFTHDP